MEVVWPATIPTNHTHAASAATPHLPSIRARAVIASRAVHDGERAFYLRRSGPIPPSLPLRPQQGQAGVCYRDSSRASSGSRWLRMTVGSSSSSHSPTLRPAGCSALNSKPHSAVMPARLL